jgi:hypothetical protein
MRRQHCRYVAALLIFGNLCQARLLQGALATVRPGFRTTSMMSAAWTLPQSANSSQGQRMVAAALWSMRIFCF